MAYCYECGEQVAEIDTFCPYCGISLNSTALAGEDDDDDSFGKTIIASQPKPAIPTPIEVKTAETLATATPIDAPPMRERLGVEKTESKTADFSTEVTADNFEMRTEPDVISEKTTENHNFDLDIPTPKILQTSNTSTETPLTENASVSEKISPRLIPNDDFSEIKTAQQIISEPIAYAVKPSAEKEEWKKGGDEIYSPSAAPVEPAPTDYDEAELTEFSSNDETEKPLDENSYQAANENIENPPIGQVLPPDGFDIGDFDLNADSSATTFKVEDEVSEKVDFAEKEIEVPEISENIVADKQPIAMPEIEMPAADAFPPSRFDSVSIMEKREEPTPETPEKIVPENSIQIDPKEPVSLTAPIVGGSDTDGKNKTKLKPLDEGTVLNGRYEIIRKIGGGGMGAVYLASDKNLGGVLRAVKEMVQSYIEDAQQEKAVSDFKRESLLLTSLDHQSIPTIYDYFFDEKEARFYLVMKYISGGDLAGRLRSAPESRIDETSVTQWAIQIVDVLDYLHNRQPPIVYRDLKPANIMVDGNSGRVMLIDFGIARWVNKEEKGVTAVGTMGYAPPELFSGNVEARSDIYSLGSTMFHLLTGADPQSNPLLIFDFQKHPRPRQINPQLSDQMERILMRSVEYSADKRFASAAELKKALEEHQENLKTGRVSFGTKEAPLSAALSDQPVFCGFCGQKIVATDMFCAFCGSKQPLAQQGVHSESYSPVPLTAQLLIIGTNDLEQPAFRLEKEDNLVGRRDPMSNIFPEVDLSKFDPQTKISRRHARIWREGSEFMVEDLGSSNGTYILPVVSDSMRLQPHQPQLLTNGDKIRLGDTTLHFILG
ncbi:MAG: protein kinase [Pyrinomonadaceae bacterium]|nr:protein kinase [Pyrinomonadaceae bacterium]